MRADARRPQAGATIRTGSVYLVYVRSYENDARAVAQHLRWPEAKVQAAFNSAKADQRSSLSAAGNRWLIAWRDLEAQEDGAAVVGKPVP
jgi:hypothetical protein